MVAVRVLYLVLRLDQAGSAAFIVVALLAAPVLALLAPFPVVVWVLGLALMAYAVMLAVLGGCMAWGLARRAARGEEVPPELWRSLLGFPRR